MKKNKTQSERILNYLETGRGLTSLDALKRFGCFRLSARAHEWNLDSRWVKTKSGKFVKSYFL